MKINPYSAENQTLRSSRVCSNRITLVDVFL